MKKVKVGSDITASAIVMGCWRYGEIDVETAKKLTQTAVECGIDFFDTADIYAGGKAEELLGEAVKQLGIRDEIMLQTKCGIRPGMFDFSKKHIISSVDNSLKRLKTDYIDVLLLHRPDTLVEPEEVAEAFDELKASGKVRHFGVSNQNPFQMELLKTALNVDIVADQLQFSLTNSSMIDAGLNVNMEHDPALMRDGGVLEYCRIKGITIQAWSPLQYGVFKGTFLDNELFPELNKTLDNMALEKGVSKAAIAFAWILRHPAKMQVIAGTTKPERLREICRASDVELSRAEWYELYTSAGNWLP